MKCQRNPFKVGDRMATSLTDAAEEGWDLGYAMAIQDVRRAILDPANDGKLIVDILKVEP